MTSRVSGPNVTVGTHRGSWWHDSYGTTLACEHCDVTTKRSRVATAEQQIRSFRRRHTIAARKPVYQPRHGLTERTTS